MATQSSVLAWRILGTVSLVGCHLWGRTESDMTEATQQHIYIYIYIKYIYNMGGLPCWLRGEKSACIAEDTGDVGSIPGWEEPLEEEMATHSSILALEIPLTEKSGGLQSLESKESDTT